MKLSYGALLLAFACITCTPVLSKSISATASGGGETKEEAIAAAKDRAKGQLEIDCSGSVKGPVSYTTDKVIHPSKWIATVTAKAECKE